MHHGTYTLNNAVCANEAYGTRDANANTIIALSPKSSGSTTTLNSLNNFTTATASNSDSRGLIVADRATGPIFTAYRNGSSIGTYTPGTNGTTFPTHSIIIGGYNNNGTPALFCSYQTALVTWGAGLSSGDHALLSTGINNYMKSMGANTY